ncbi:MAG: hypothetical protein M3Y03_06980 [Verrucomicrobiota bacterium]|nr:hypothetical protein [Verrucomicrobiota bacterium]
MTLMTPLKLSRPSRRYALALVCVFALSIPGARANDSKSIKGFREAIIKLSPTTVDPSEAAQVAVISHETARRLAKEWRVVPPANFQNFLIHIGKRQRGFCFHWAHGIGKELRKVPFKTLQFYWAEADARTRLEHNVIVVTALGQPMNTGYIIDGWRNAGRLVWWPVLKDDVVWKENAVETAWMQNRGDDPLKALDEPLAPANAAATPATRQARRN